MHQYPLLASSTLPVPYKVQHHPHETCLPPYLWCTGVGNHQPSQNLLYIYNHLRVRYLTKRYTIYLGQGAGPVEACTDTLKKISLYIYFIDLTKVPHTVSKLKDLTWSRSSSSLTRRSLTHTHCGTKHKGNREGKFCASFVGSTAIVPPAGIAHMHTCTYRPAESG